MKRRRSRCSTPAGAERPPGAAPPEGGEIDPFADLDLPDAPANHVLVKNYSVVGLHWGLYRKHDPGLFWRTHEELVRLVGEGKIDPLVGDVLPLDQAPQALARLADRGTVGKVVLVP